MSVAVIGLTAIQIYWLSYSINLNEAKFDESVRSTLQEVKRQLEAYDEQMHETYSGISLNRKRKSNLKITSDIYKTRLQALDSLDASLLDPDMRPGLQDYRRLTNKMDITERINIEKLDLFIKNQLESSSIPIRYDYAIYSEEIQDFVIANGHYVTPISGDVQASTVQTPSKKMDINLRNSPYSIRLFNSGYEAPGALVLHFPERTSHIWSNVLPMLFPYNLIYQRYFIRLHLFFERHIQTEKTIRNEK